ncbi:hypothetical protein M8C21_030166, partial [Ambrosia artemisiifolia]
AYMLKYDSMHGWLRGKLNKILQSNALKWSLDKDKGCRVKNRVVAAGLGLGLGDQWSWRRPMVAEQELAKLDFLASVLGLVALTGVNSGAHSVVEEIKLLKEMQDRSGKSIKRSYFGVEQMMDGQWANEHTSKWIYLVNYNSYNATYKGLKALE